MAKASPASGTFVALLRGINVGGNNKLPMKDLVAMFDRAGCLRVRHYIQSGNVVFAAPPAVVKRIPEVVTAAIEKELGLRVPVIVRSRDALHAVARANPYLADGAQPNRLYVMFLADEPRAADVASLDPARSPPETYVVQGREIYLSCPHGIGASKLTNAYFDSKLHTVSTGRNWNTVLKLAAMCDE